MAKSIDLRMKGLSRAVRSEVRSECDAILDEARAKAESITQKAQQQAEETRKQIVEDAQKEADGIRAEATASAKLKAQMLWLERREKLLDDVFAAVIERMKEIPGRPDYEAVLKKLVAESVERLDAGDLVIHADRKSHDLINKKMLADLQSENGVILKLGSVLEDKTGVVLETADGRRQYDNTFEARLDRQQNSLRPAVYRVMMGESQ